VSDHKLTCIDSDYIAHLDGVTEIDGGWINKNYIQLGYQLADSVTGMAYAFFGTCIILFLMNLVPGLSLRAPEEDEIMGIDDAEIGEFAVSIIASQSTQVTFLTFIL
jgi:Amt family ammonium transporter